MREWLISAINLVYQLLIEANISRDLFHSYVWIEKR